MRTGRIAGKGSAAVPDCTLRWTAPDGGRRVYARALLELATYARTHGDNFTFGPLDLATVEHNGLTITGPDLTGVRKLLDSVPGLTAEEQP